MKLQQSQFHWGNYETFGVKVLKKFKTNPKNHCVTFEKVIMVSRKKQSTLCGDRLQSQQIKKN